jgi:ABC-type tungstate transport system permease subunit
MFFKNYTFEEYRKLKNVVIKEEKDNPVENLFSIEISYPERLHGYNSFGLWTLKEFIDQIRENERLKTHDYRCFTRAVTGRTFSVFLSLSKTNNNAK